MKTNELAQDLPLEEVAVNNLNPRNIAREGAFLLPYLQTGKKILDAGCGNGSMAYGFAKYIYPGQVIGVDNNETQISLAKELIENNDNINLEFVNADLYSLPFEDNFFDIVFSHNLFIHLDFPDKALKEINRVCKPGGIIGLREGLSNQLYYSGFPLTDKFKDLSDFINTTSMLGKGTPDIGLRLKGMLDSAGFINANIEVHSEIYNKAEDMDMLKIWYIGLLSDWMGDLAVEHKLINEQELQQLLDSIEKWDDDPAALNIITWIEYISTCS